MPQLPLLRGDSYSLTVNTNEGKANILIRQFFPPPAQADLSDINEDMPVGSPLWIEQDVMVQEALEDLAQLSSKKAPGPDGIPNEALKACREEIALAIAELVKACFKARYFS